VLYVRVWAHPVVQHVHAAYFAMAICLRGLGAVVNPPPPSFACRTSLVDIAALIDKLSNLQAIAVRGNPFMTKNPKKSRVLLLGRIQRLKDHGCRLRIVDTPISVDERIGAWLQLGEKEVGFAALCFTCTPCVSPHRQPPSAQCPAPRQRCV
jgi:hypothetical protein